MREQAELRELGGYCDCEVMLNVIMRFRARVRVRQNHGNS
jgi:hypothetical protein